MWGYCMSPLCFASICSKWFSRVVKAKRPPQGRILPTVNSVAGAGQLELSSACQWENPSDRITRF